MLWSSLVINGSSEIHRATLAIVSKYPDMPPKFQLKIRNNLKDGNIQSHLENCELICRKTIVPDVPSQLHQSSVRKYDS